MRIKRIGNHTLPLPSRATSGSAGFDLRVKVDVLLDHGCVAMVPTGFSFEIPFGCTGIVSMRSSMAKVGLVVAQGIGVIDCDYRGEVLIPVYNRGKTQTLYCGERIAQIVIMPFVAPATLHEVDELDETERGDGGFGSTDGSDGHCD